MTTFGMSSYLKLISLPPRPQKTELKRRLSPGDKPYDYHRSLRLLIKRLLLGEPLEQVRALANVITMPAERQSATTGIDAFLAWRDRNSFRVSQFEPLVRESPAGLFKVKFSSDLTFEDSGIRVAVYVWNTQRPELDLRMMYGALSLFSQALSSPFDLAILSLRNGRLYRLAEASDHTAIGMATMTSIERLFLDIQSELHLPSQMPNQRPTSPPPM